MICSYCLTVLGTSGKTLLRHMLEHRSTETPSQLAQQLSLVAFGAADEAEAFLAGLCKEAIEALPEEAAKVRDGHMKVVNTLVGRVMRSSRGRADAKHVRERMIEMLGVE